MMKLSTSFTIPRASVLIRPNSQLLCIGSCFAENLGNKLAELPLKVSNQALGTIFHPLSILRGLQPQPLQMDELVQQGSLYVHPDFHGQFMGENPSDFLAKLQEVKTKAITYLASSQFLVITWGTAFYYEDQVLGRAIANCHKQASSRFIKKQSTVEEICAGYEAFIHQNPRIQIILTVSPVRHTKDGIPENAVSKAILRIAAEQLAKKIPEQVVYFPAFELMLDELRDYRFYQADLIHPTEQAIQYIYERFMQAHFDDTLQATAKKWQEIYLTMRHRPHPLQFPQHREILQRLRKEIEMDQSGIDSSQLLVKIDQQILALS
jgi:hypothetical protein